ncbi:glycosyl transferase family 28 [Prauserella marina]|uniref:L-2-deoxyfucosyltransferase n=1 Tax=Prauserella marina TaxID=530584 RepID=A0A222VLY1_9PSEU|nr:activator-dependent family glycosyltransferase [Prauserella marina]ASR34887.1 glycosyl transferase family 28 [Prauserella marina]PWV85411.1 L-2-deoxyfucosyltransferase [Prauserella marina]SDC55465.1 L-2-deoxyfucosyltransferase [Prauserella marina]
MRVLFTTFAAKTHMFAQVPMAWALHTAGHEVYLASQPDLAELISRTGLTAVGVGDPLNLEEQLEAVNENVGDDANRSQDEAEVGLDMSEEDPAKLTWDHTLKVFTAMTSMVFQNECPESMMDDLVDFSRSWRPDLIVWDTMTFGGAVAARASGAAHARLLYGLDIVGNTRAAFTRHLDSMPPESRDDPMAEWLGFTLERYGCDSGFAEDMVVGDFSIDQFPQSMRFPLDVATVPVRYSPYNGPAVVPDWLYDPPKSPRVCVTLGLSHRDERGGDRASIGDLLAAISDLDVEVIATLNAAQLKSLPSIPDNVRVVDFVPLNALLPTCAAVIHHGGSGTLTTAMLHGVPQLIVPHMVWDSINTARRLEEYGAGHYVRDIDRLSGGELRAQLVKLLTEQSYKDNAAKLRREMLGTPSPNDIVPVLENLTGEYRRAR